MDFELTDDQFALQEGIASLCEGRFDIDAVRAMVDGLDRDRWAELAETGVFGLALSEAEGGVGLGWADAVVVFEQLGRFLVPGPLVGTTLAAGLVDGAIDGSAVVGIVERADPAVIDHLPWLDQLVVLDDDGVHLIDPSGLDATVARQPLDVLTPIGTVAQLPAGDQIAGRDVAAEWRVRGAVLTSALQLGLSLGATELAVAYAKEREQFGKPIGAFQAVKHRCAEMASRTEVLRAAVYAAGVCLDDTEAGDAARAASVARVLATAAAAASGKDAVQVHGGMGYTWEVDAHLFLKRAWVLDQAFGDGTEHAEALAAAL